MDEVDNDTRIDLLKCLKYVIKTSKNVVKIFVTTRMDTDILMQFEIFPRIELEPDDNVGDINGFIETKVQSMIDDGQLLYGKVSKELQNEIYNVLCQRCKGKYASPNPRIAQMLIYNDSFQLAALHLGFLRKMHSERDVKQNLTTLPDTLALAYNQVYDAIFDQKGSAPQIALNAFRWIQCSNEPLASETLLDAVTVEVDSSGEFCQTGPGNVAQLLTVCQNFIIFDKTLDVFRFAHLSVDEYLDTRLAKHDSHTELSKVCLSLLCSNHSTWEAYNKNRWTREGAYKNRHLLLYAVVFWPWHLARCGDFDHSPIVSLLWEKLSRGNIYERWCDYHGTCVAAYSWRGSGFWQRHEAIKAEGYDRILFFACLGYIEYYCRFSHPR